MKSKMIEWYKIGRFEFKIKEKENNLSVWYKEKNRDKKFVRYTHPESSYETLGGCYYAILCFLEGEI
jgi:hypothetical protein